MVWPSAKQYGEHLHLRTLSLFLTLFIDMMNQQLIGKQNRINGMIPPSHPGRLNEVYGRLDFNFVF